MTVPRETLDEARREAFFKFLEETAAEIGRELSQEELKALIEEAVREVRAERYARERGE